MPLKKGRGKRKGAKSEREKKTLETKEKGDLSCFISTHSSNLI